MFLPCASRCKHTSQANGCFFDNVLVEGSSTAVRPDAYNRYFKVLLSMFAHLPRHVPTKANLAKGLRMAADKLGIEIGGKSYAKKVWANTQGMHLRALMVQLRRNVRKNGKGARWRHREL